MRKEKFDWFRWGRDKQKLMSEVIENARLSLDRYRASNFRYKDLAGQERIKKEFNWSEFVPTDQNGKSLLKSSEVLEALGVSQDLKVEDMPKGKTMANGDNVGKMPTTVPGLNYVYVQSPTSTFGYGYFQAEDVGEEVGKNTRSAPPIAVEKKEALADYNKRVWGQLGADAQAAKELDEIGEKIKRESSG